MNCFLLTGAPCQLQQSKRSDLFEVHVTIEPQQSSDIDTLLAICSQQRWKAIIIDLKPPSPNQPMTCSRITGTIDDAFSHAKQVQRCLQQAGLLVNRVKIEAAPWNSQVPHSDQERQQHDPSAYFEYHLKLALSANNWQETLPQICHSFQAHLSHNALKHEANGTIQRFATIRSSTLGLERFQAYTQAFQDCVDSAGFTILKAITEFCIYDSNSALDNSWLAQTQAALSK